MSVLHRSRSPFAESAPTANAPPPAGRPQPPARISFRQPVTELGYVDAGWWPRSRELRAELPLLLDVLWTACRDVNRVSYGTPFWEPVPRRIRVEDRIVSLRGIRGQDPSLLTLFDSAGRDHIDILVVPPEADAAFAERVLELTGGMGSVEPPDRILATARSASGGHA